MRQQWKRKVEKEVSKIIADNRVGELYDEGKAKTEGFPERDLSSHLNDMLKAVKDFNCQDITYETEIEINEEKYILDTTPVEERDPKVYEVQDKRKGFAVTRSCRSLIVAFYDTSEIIMEVTDEGTERESEH